MAGHTTGGNSGVKRQQKRQHKNSAGMETEYGNKNEQQVSEIMPEPIEEPKKSKKGQMAKGVACGIAGTILVGFVALNVVTKITGTKIYITNATAKTDSILDTKTVQKINELKAYTDMYYYDNVDDTELKDGLYEGMISGLGDKYSVYYNEEDYKQMQVSTTGQYYGIGAGLRQDPDTMVVSISKIYEGTPSDEAGLLADDVITSVDGTDATSMEVTELVKLIRGEEGTSVHLEVYRPSTGENLSFDVERKNVTLPSVSSQMLGDNIGYIHIDSFETETADQFEKAVAELDSEGMKALVLDVRYNGGGLVTAVVQILDDILPEGTVVYTEDKTAYVIQAKYYPKGDIKGKHKDIIRDLYYQYLRLEVKKYTEKVIPVLAVYSLNNITKPALSILQGEDYINVNREEKPADIENPEK